MQPTLCEMFEHLGADPVTARRLADERIDPLVLLGFDHPDSEAFLDESWDRYYDNWQTALVMSFPSFDPTVLERFSRSLWSKRELTGINPLFPGPLNRLCAIAEGGVHPEICDSVGWRAEAGREIVGLLDDAATGYVTDFCAVPVLITDGAMEIEISLGGTTLNPMARAEQAVYGLGGPTLPAIGFLAWWDSVIRPYWPRSFLTFGNLDRENLVIKSPCVAGHTPFEHLYGIRGVVMVQRLREIAPGLADWRTAFAEEHPGFR